jgi:DNA-binding MarR family transcriptional regulator
MLEAHKPGSRNNAISRRIRHAVALRPAILRCFTDGKPWRTKALLRKLRSTACGPLIYRELHQMVTAGLIQRLGRSVYCSADAFFCDTIAIPRHKYRKRKGGRLTDRKMMELLKEPMSGPQLRDALSISRQRLAKLLQPRIKAGGVSRIKIDGERIKFLFVRTKNLSKHPLVFRTPELTHAHARLLSQLSSQKLHRLHDVAYNSNSFTAGKHVDQLSALGLAISIKIGSRQYVAITKKGSEHPQYALSAPKAVAIDRAKDFEAARIQHIQCLGFLGVACTSDLSELMPARHFNNGGITSGNVMRQLRRLDLIETVEPREKKHVRYRLTTKGRALAETLAEILPPLTNARVAPMALD